MTNYPQPSITVNVDVTNPGQFFACCGLLELADRLWPGAEGWFSDDGSEFNVACDGTLSDLVNAIASANLVHTNPADLYSSPLVIAEPFRPLSIDWWETNRCEGLEGLGWNNGEFWHRLCHATCIARREVPWPELV